MTVWYAYQTVIHTITSTKCHIDTVVSPDDGHISHPEHAEKRNKLVCIPDSHPHRITNIKCHIDTVVSPDDEHIVAQNMQRK
jgi:hypothetical protein